MLKFLDGTKCLKKSRRAWRTSSVQVAHQHQETAENEQRVQHLLNTDWRLSVHMIAEQLGMDKMVVHKIIGEDLGMRKICAKLMPKVLGDVQKQNREAVLKYLLERIKKTLFFDNVITGMKVGSFSTTLRQNVRATNGTLRNRLDRRKLACPSRE
ncbi:hypothetical protein TNCV_1816961 [Trichonephila clavipes]|nr:hypothetical protein TNCV_1816961 [Trichonephila clavipes]